jgi:polyisoprenoid-binding protein YceI
MKNLILASIISTLAVAAHANVFKLDTTASAVEWKGTKKIGSFHTGNVKIKEGQIDMNPKGDITGGNIVIDMKTITNTDLKDDPSNQKKLVGHLSNEDFFNVEKFPTATFKIKSATKKSATEVILKGDFTIIGKTNAIEVPAKIMVDKGSATGEAMVKIDRTKWGLKYGSGNFFKELAGDRIINDEFELKINLTAKK